MSDDVPLRVATARDAGIVAAVHRVSRAWYYRTEPDPGDGREEMWSRLLGQPGRLTFVAGSAAGTAGFLSAIRTARPRPALELTALYVLPEHMGTGVGSRLHDRYDAERGEDEEGSLEVWEGNAGAVAFYRRRGWVPTPSTRPGPQGGDYVTYRLPPRRRGG